MRSHQAWLGLGSSVLMLSGPGFAYAQDGIRSQSESVPAHAALRTPSVLPADSKPHSRIHLGAHLGLGELRLRIGEYAFWGRTFPLQAWAGISLSRNLVLFGELYDAHVFHPSSTYGALTDLNLLGFGPGVRVYLTPADVYVSVSALISRVSFDNGVSADDYLRADDPIDEQTDWGTTARLAIGKDWQMSKGWRLGLEGEVYFGWMDFEGPYSDYSETGRARGFSLLASASYNYDPIPHGPLNCKGIHMDARLGTGKLWTSFDGRSISGTSIPIDLWIGAALTRRLVLYASARYAHVFGPSSSSPSLQQVDFYGFGPAAKYYIASTNVFLSGALLLSQLRVDDDRVYHAQHTRWGLSADVSLGREFWLTHHFGLGIAANLLLGRMGTADAGTTTATALSLLTLATYNQGPVMCCDRDERNFYLEARIGGGYLWSEFAGDAVAGGRYPLGLSTGWAVTRRLVLLGDFSLAHLAVPTPEDYLGLDSGILYTVGPRAKYYISSTGFFVSGALLLSRLDFDLSESWDVLSTHWGLSANLSFGKEWLVSEHWSLGAAGDFLLGRMSAGQYGDYWTRGVSLLALASFNYPRLLTELAEMPPAPQDQRAFALPSAAFADMPGPSAPDGHHTHDGLYAGARLGAGWLTLKRVGYGNDPLSGRGWPLALSVGFALTRSLVLFGEYYAFQVRPSSESWSDIVDLDLQAVGPGATYYLMPINIFASASLSLSQASYRNGMPLNSRYGTNVTSDWGIMGRLSLGKEWWLSSNLGIGLAGEVLFGRMGDSEGSGQDAESHFTAKGFSLLATASFN